MLFHAKQIPIVMEGTHYHGCATITEMTATRAVDNTDGTVVEPAESSTPRLTLVSSPVPALLSVGVLVGASVFNKSKEQPMITLPVQLPVS